MKLKKIAAMLMAGVMCIGLMAGCGSSDKNAQTDSTDPKDRTQLTVGFDAEFPPYGYKNGDDYEGFDLDLAQAVCDYYGWKLVKQPIDWDSKDMELSGGSIDCIWNGFTMNGREDDYTWSKPYIDTRRSLLSRRIPISPALTVCPVSSWTYRQIPLHWLRFRATMQRMSASRLLLRSASWYRYPTITPHLWIWNPVQQMPLPWTLA